MKIWPLKVLFTVLEEGSLHGAAKILHRTAPALSMTLQKLEDEVGFAILDRTGYRLQLTPQGTQFKRHAEELMRQHERLNSAIGQLREGAEPQLHIAYDYTCNPELLIDALRGVQQQFPFTEVIVSGHSQLESLQDIQTGVADLALTPWLPTFQQLADFESLRIGDFQLVVVMSQGLIEQHGIPRTRDELSALPYILPKELNMGINPEQIYRVSGSSRLRVNDAHTLVQYVKAGMGWGVVPRDLIRRELKSKKMVEIDIPGFLDHIHAEIHVVKMAAKHLGPAARSVWEAFAKQVHRC